MTSILFPREKVLSFVLHWCNAVLPNKVCSLPNAMDTMIRDYRREEPSPKRKILLSCGETVQEEYDISEHVVVVLASRIQYDNPRSIVSRQMPLLGLPDRFTAVLFPNSQAHWNDLMTQFRSDLTRPSSTRDADRNWTLNDIRTSKSCLLRCWVHFLYTVCLRHFSTGVRSSPLRRITIFTETCKRISNDSPSISPFFFPTSKIILGPDLRVPTCSSPPPTTHVEGNVHFSMRKGTLSDTSYVPSYMHFSAATIDCLIDALNTSKTVIMYHTVHPECFQSLSRCGALPLLLTIVSLETPRPEIGPFIWTPLATAAGKLCLILCGGESTLRKMSTVVPYFRRVLTAEDSYHIFLLEQADKYLSALATFLHTASFQTILRPSGISDFVSALRKVVTGSDFSDDVRMRVFAICVGLLSGGTVLTYDHSTGTIPLPKVAWKSEVQRVTATATTCDLLLFQTPP